MKVWQSEKKKESGIITASFSFYKLQIRVMLLAIIWDWDFSKLLNISLVFSPQQLFFPLRSKAEAQRSAMAV